MDPNHWNTYNLQYGHSAPGGLTPSHPSLNRLDLSSGLALGHSLPSPHGALAGRPMPSLSTVNYSALGAVGVPILDTMSPLATAAISAQSPHKNVGLSQGQIVFDPQVRVSAEQQSPSLARYESPGAKALARDAATRNQQLLEAAAARVWGNTNFTPNLYNQFGSLLPEVSAAAAAVNIASNPVARSTPQPQAHEPPPAHSSNAPRQSTVQRTPYSSELFYSRSSESLVPSSLAHVSSLYSSSSNLSKQVTLGIQQQHHHHQQQQQQSQSLPRQSSIHSFTPQNTEIEDLSSNSQSQLYSSYGHLVTVTDSQDFSSAHLAGDINYEAVSPATPLNAGGDNNVGTVVTIQSQNPEHLPFSMVQFPDIANLTPEHAHAIADKFSENDFRLKLDSRTATPHGDALNSSNLLSDRQEVRPQKEAPTIMPVGISLQRSGHFQIPGNHGLPGHPQTSTLSLSQAAPQTLYTTSALQSAQAPIPVQAMADSTTKPKKSRSRKKKDPAAPATTSKKSNNRNSNSSTHTVAGSSSLTHTPQPAHILNMPPSSHISLPHESTSRLRQQLQQQQQQQQQSHQHFGNAAGNNQFVSNPRNNQRAQTPSIPHNFSIQEHQGYPQSTKSINLSTQSIRNQAGRIPNEKTSYKQQSRKSSVSVSENSQIYHSNIHDTHQVQQTYHPDLLGDPVDQRGSPMQSDGRSSDVSRLSSYDQSQQKLLQQGHMSPLVQASPQRSLAGVSAGFNSNVGKINPDTGQMMATSAVVVQSPMNSRPVSVEPSAIVHSYEGAHTTSTLIETPDAGQFQIDFVGQPFLEQLVAPMNASQTTYVAGEGEGGEVVYTALVAPSESVHLEQQQQESSGGDNTFRPTYHGETVHEIRPVGPLTTGMGMEEVGFNTFFTNQPFMAQQQLEEQQQQQDAEAAAAEAAAAEAAAAPQQPKEPEMTLTFMPHVVEDDELYHFSQPDPEEPPVIMVKKEPVDPSLPSTSKPVDNKDSFQGSFLSYLQGNKQETLSSLSTATITKKPILPKYIPEPRRPRPPPPPPAKEVSGTSDKEDRIPVKRETVPTKKEPMLMLSDTDNSSQKSESDKEGYSVQRTSELAVKITLPKKKNKFGPFAENTLLKDSMRRNKELMKWKNRKKKGGKHQRDVDMDEFLPETVSEEEEFSEPEVRAATPPPTRTSIGRKAKEKCLEKTKKKRKMNDSDSSEEEIKKKSQKNIKVYASDDSEKDYDSDKDPAWMPFEVDLKQGSEIDEKKRKNRRPKLRGLSSSFSKTPKSLPAVVKTPKSLPAVVKPSAGPTNPRPSTSSKGGMGRSQPSDSVPQSIHKIGEFVIEKKDMNNYEGYPIWRVEPGNMIRKFEARVVNGCLRHRAVGTYSTWMKSMEHQFQVVKVKHITVENKGDPVFVEVLEESRPKPPTDGRLELEYEDDPLVDPFTVYLQVFLSQALEPNFLKVIIETDERFYVDALNQIDQVIDAKCQEISKLAKWRAAFQECVHRSPLMKEIDRPNLKQACQASENSNPPTIKSVLLSGQPYDKCLLTHSAGAPETAQEYMIGKVAAMHVRPYHSLYHYKYWLKQRCETKVKMMKDGGKSGPVNNEAILDKCLENRAWVLQLFDGLKKLLKFGQDSSR